MKDGETLVTAMARRGCEAAVRALWPHCDATACSMDGLSAIHYAGSQY
jgi:hypothetical protein